MSSIRIVCSRIWVPALFVIALVGCGESNEQNFFSTDGGGAHMTGWLPGGHKDAAGTSNDSCKECHGTDLAGGISKVSCTQCHLGSPQDVHPLAWGDLTYARHPGYVNQNGTSACANIQCHGVDLTGVTSSGPSCSSCHIGGSLAVHPSTDEWSISSSQGFHGTYVKNHGTASCANIQCHGANLQGVTASGFSCTACHSDSLYLQYIN
jgi:hypothetical protein